MENIQAPDLNDKTYDLTQSQLMMWMGQKLSPVSPMYNMALTFDLPFAVDVAHFKRSFRLLIEHCDAMRTVIEEVNGQPRQKILGHFPYELEVLDFSKKENKVAACREWVNQHSQSIFDITALMFESVLIKMDDQHYIWFFNQHHLITDAWAMTLQYRAVTKWYKQLSEGMKPDLSIPLFEDYIQYEAKQRQEAAGKKSTQYWADKIDRLPDAPDFFGVTVRTMDSSSERISMRLTEEQTAALRALTSAPDLRAWTQHLSLFNIFSTLVIAFIHRLTGQHHLAIGTPAHNRTNTAFKATPGLFIELFPLMAELDQEETFIGLFKKIQNESLEFLKHAQPGSSKPELSRSFNVVLNYINATFSDFNGHHMSSEWVHSGHADPGHHLRVQVHDFDGLGNIELCFDLNTAVFSESQRALVPQQFARLLNSFIEDRKQPIAKPSLAENPVPIQAPNTDFHFGDESTVLDLIEKQVEKLAENQQAVRYGESSVDYKELNQHVNQLAHYLLQNNVEKGDRVAILLRRSPEFIIAVLAVMKVGATFVPVPVNYPSGRILGIIEDAAAKLILSNTAESSHLRTSFDNLICLDKEAAFIQQQKRTSPNIKTEASDLAYLMYTSGSTGLPKGVMVAHQSLSHYIQWARHSYVGQAQPVVPLFTSLGFDLTITSLFLPLVAGGTLVVYPEPEDGPDLSLMNVVEDNAVDFIKLTPSHLLLLQGQSYKDSRIKTMIVGGENFKTDLAEFVQNNFKSDIQIYNEYGPTEATVGCVVHRYEQAKDHAKTSVPIGHAIANTNLYILDEYLHPVPEGVVGELYIGGHGLAKGYWQQEALTQQQFINNSFEAGSILYISGDLVRQHSQGYLEYFGRKDLQVKIRGRRVELAEIETVLNQHPSVTLGVVELRERRKVKASGPVHNCVECGLPSNYPGATFSEKGVCNLCESFASYQEKVKQYFKTETDLRNLFNQYPSEGDYDCLALLSGGKDSTYALAKLKEMGLRVLAFTLDNGYISDEAKDNVSRVVAELGVDHVFGETEAMNAIFVDSLQRHCNVCDGCFKTIYTLSVQLALEKKIPFIVTGLSRGQFFETRLTEELFNQKEVDIDKIDEMILNARKAYHQVDDAVKELLDVSMFEDEQIFEKVRFIDYYRYSDVSLDEMLEYLDTRVPWIRPSDTGRSTNCLINKAGIYVHKKERGYSNYAFPYSWDVRVGHKTRDASLEEINEEIPEQQVLQILDEIGYTQAKATDQKNEQLVAYYASTETVSEATLSSYLRAQFPDYMVPVQFIRLDQLPITVNGKIDREALPQPDAVRPVLQMEYVEARTEFEEIIQEVWSEVMQIDQVGVLDNFIELGGDSLTGIRIVSRLNEAFELDLPVNLIFQKPTIARLGEHIETMITALLQEMENEE